MTDLNVKKESVIVDDRKEEKRSGICMIKPEYIIENIRSTNSVTSSDCKENGKEKSDGSIAADESEEPPNKKIKGHNKKDKPRGQNKNRSVPFKIVREQSLCPWVAEWTAEEADKAKCPNKHCSFIHDHREYLKIKPEDIGSECQAFELTGKCMRGASCRMGSKHTTADGYNIVNVEKQEAYKKQAPLVKNQIGKEILEKLKKYKYDFARAEKIAKKYNWKSSEKFDKTDKEDSKVEHKEEEEPKVEHKKEEQEEHKEQEEGERRLGPVLDEGEIRLRPSEKRRIEWKDKVMLAPLTTVGNLPFRRICKEYGADITCGEMALAPKLLKGAREEWALVKRHASEDLFGVQLAGSNPGVLTRCAQLLDEEAEVDFVDLNLGCPIDLVYKSGAGCGMMNRPGILESVVRSASEVLTVPLTVKARTGVYADRPIAHKLAPRLREWGAAMLNIHGRSREQRYTKLADWAYVEECAQAAQPMPVYGTGDVLSYEDYARARATCPSLAGVSVARGALIKPWLFQEIKQQAARDVPSGERLDMLRRFAGYGLEHWGSDTRGVETTRRFMLEWLSFLYRYVPLGLLEVPPQKMNDRPPYFRGRDELETLMASPNCADWIKISEMLLGKVPPGFNFLPKHKANSWK